MTETIIATARLLLMSAGAGACIAVFVIAIIQVFVHLERRARDRRDI